MKQYLLLFLSLVLFLLTLEPLHFYWASWVMFVPAFLSLLEKPMPVIASLFGFIVGVSFTGGSIYWSFQYDSEIATKIILLSSIPFAVFFGGIAVALDAWKLNLDQKKNLILIFGIPILLWVSLWELLGMSPVGALPLETPFYQVLPFMQLIAFGGMQMLFALVFFVNISLALCLYHPRKLQKYLLVAACSCAVAIYAAGSVRLIQNSPTEDGTKIALVQTNLPYNNTWRDEHKVEILNTYTQLTERAAESQPEIIVFPQYSIPLDVLREPSFIEELARRANAYIILASYVPQQEGKTIDEVGFSNVGFVFSPTEGLVGDYRSVVGPPFRDAKQFFGEEYPDLNTPVGKIGLLLCYEDTVRWVAEKWLEKDVDALFVVTNPGTFTGSVMPLHHIKQDRIRALENNRPVVRVTPNGYSAVIDRFGRTRVQSQLHQQEVIVTHL